MLWSRGHAWDIIIPNFFHGMYEMDVFKLSKSGVLIEYEIKISKADFKNDFKKSWQEIKYDIDEENKLKTTVHKQITKHQDIETGNRCNRFFFVVPDGLIDIEEIPEYAGLIYYDEEHDNLRIVKNAKLIHKNKMIGEEIYKNLALKLSFREQHWKGYYRHSQFEVKRLEKKIKNLELQIPTI